MRPGNHVASSHPDYTPEEFAILKELDDYATTHGKRMMSVIEVYRFLKSRRPGEFDAVDDDGSSCDRLPIVRVRPREYVLSVVDDEEDDDSV